MIIGPITPAEVADCVALVNGAYRGAGATQGWTHEATLLEGQRTDAAMLRHDLDNGVTILALRVDDQLLGCVAVEARNAAPWSIGMLTVSPGQQDRGWGRALLNAAEQWIERHGGTAAVMTVIQTRTALIAWYGRRGYAPTGVTVPFPYGDARFGTPLRADLHFVILQKELRPGCRQPNVA